MLKSLVMLFPVKDGLSVAACMAAGEHFRQTQSQQYFAFCALALKKHEESMDERLNNE